VNSFVDVLDQQKVWRVAIIKEINNDQARFSFDGWNGK